MPVNLIINRTTSFHQDNDEIGVYDPGDVIYTRITVTNSGDTNATGVEISDSFVSDLFGSTLVADTLNVSPIAFNDTFTAVGNTVFKVGAAGQQAFTAGGALATGPSLSFSGNLLSNDTGQAGIGNGAIVGDVRPGFTIDAVSKATAGGGSVEIYSDGSFRYISQAGDANPLQNPVQAGDTLPSDSFTYTIRDVGLDNMANTADDLTSTATVKILLSGEVWYVDSTGGNDSTGTGTSSNPFQTMTKLNGVTGDGTTNDDVDGDGDSIYVQGTATGPITLESNQLLIGQGADLKVGAFTIATAGSNSSLSHSGGGFVVTVNANNTIAGLNITGTSGTGGITDNLAGSFGTLSLNPSTLNAATPTYTSTVNVNGAALSLSDGTIAGNGFGSTTSNGGANNVLLTNIGGTLNLGSGSMSSSTAGNVAFSVNGGNASIDYNGSFLKTSDGRVIEVQNKTGGTVSFDGPVNVATAGDGINLVNNAGTTFAFTGILNLNTSASGTTAFSATGASGAGSGGTLTITNVANTISSGAGQALVITNTNIGAADVTFRRIDATAGANNAIHLDTTGSAGGLNVTGTGSAGTGGTITGRTGADGSLTAGSGIYLNNTADVFLDRMIISNNQNFGIRGTDVNGFTLQNSTLSGPNGNNASFDEGSLFFANSSGTLNILNNAISGGFEDNLRILYDSATPDTAVWNIQGNQFTALQAAGQNAMINLRSATSASTSTNVTFNIGHPTNAALMNSFDNSANELPPGGTQWWADGILVTFEGGFQHNINIDKNTFTKLFQAIDFAVNFSADTTARIYDNTITYTEGVAAIAFGSASSSTAQMLFQMLIEDNDIGGLGNNSGSRLGSGIVADFRGAETSRVTIHDNVIRDTEVNPIQIISQSTANAQTHLRITNNNISSIDDDAGGGFGAIPGINIVTNNSTNGDIYLTLTNNASTSLGGEEHVVIRQATTDNTFLIEDLPGGAGTNAALVEAHLETQNPGTTVRIRTVSSVVNYGTMNNNNSNTPAPFTPMLADSAPPEPTEEKLVDTPQIDNGDGGDIPSPPAATNGGSVVVDDGVLTQAELDFIVDAAIQRWAESGATAEQLAAMRAVSVSVSDLGGLMLGRSDVGTIVVDDDAGGWRWFVDSTPGDDSEYAGSGTRLTAASASSVAGTRMDLLTVVTHELGHQIGLADSYEAGERDELMYGTVSAGERRLPGSDDHESASGVAVDGAFAASPINIGTLPAGQSVVVEYRSTVNAPAPGGLVGHITGQTTIIGNNFAAVQSDADAGTAGAQPFIALIDSLSLGNLVYTDSNKDGDFDVGEPGLSGVLLRLFVDDGDGVFDSDDLYVGYNELGGGAGYQQGIDTPAAAGTGTPLTTTSGLNGVYSFSSLAPGNYIVVVDASNFGAGVLGTRRAHLGAVDPDNNLDGDNNADQFLVGQPGTYAATKAITLDYGTEGPDFNTVTPVPGYDNNQTLDIGFDIPNQPPSGTNHTAAIDEDSPRTLTAADFPFTDAEGHSLTEVVISAVSNGTLSVGGTDVTVFPATVTLVQLNGNSVVFTPTQNLNGTGVATISFQVRDSGGTVNGGVDLDQSANTLTFNIAAVNDPVTTSAPTTATLDEDSVNFAVTGLSISDVDAALAPSGVYVVTLSSTNGTLTLTTTTGLTFSAGDGSGDSTMTFRGTFANINTALATTKYTPTADYAGAAEIQFSATDTFGGTVATGTGAATNDSDTIAVTVTAVNDAPALDLNGIVAGLDSAATYTEDGPATALAPDAVLSDVDDTNIEGATVSVGTGFISGADMLTLGGLLNGTTGTGGAIGFSYNITTGVMTLTGSASVADYQAALRAVAFYSTSQSPGTSRTINWSVTDGTASSPAATTAITVNSVNDAPLGTPKTLETSEDDALTITWADFGFSDPNDNHAPLSVIITQLETDGRLLLNGADVTLNQEITKADIDLNLLTFVPDANEYASPYATFQFKVRDSGGTANTGLDTDQTARTMTINVTPDNLPPTANDDSGFVTAEDTPIDLSTQLTSNDTDPETDTLTITGVSNFVNGTASVTGGVVTFTPAANYVGAASFDYTVSDGNGNTDTATASLNVTAVNDSPVLDLNGAGAGTGTNNAAAEEDPIGTGSIAPAATVTDIDSANFDTGTLTVEITANAQVGDLLRLHAYTDGGGNSVNFASGEVSYNGTVVGTFTVGDHDTPLVITFDPDATPTAVQYVTRAVVFSHNGPAPSTAARTLTYTLTDGDGGSNSAVATVSVTPGNDAPASTPPTDATIGWTEDTSPVALMQGVVLSDIDLPANFTGGSLTINVSGGQGGINFRPGSLFSVDTGRLIYDDAGTPRDLGAISLIGTTNVAVTGLTSEATLARLNDLVDDFTFYIFGHDPTAGDRTVTMTFNDGNNTGSVFSTALSTVETQTLTVTAVNDAPTLDLDNTDPSEDTSVAYTEDGPLVLLAPNAAVTDPDDANLEAATVTISAGRVAGDALSLNGSLSGNTGTGGAIAYSYDSTTGVLTLTGTASKADYEAALRLVAFNSSSQTPGTSRTVTWTVNDGSAPSADRTTTIAVTASDDPPVAQNDGDATTENAPKVVTILANDSDVDGPAPAVAEIDGQAVTAGQTITLTGSGARVTLNNDGTITYDPNGQYDWLVVASSGAANSIAVDTFTYKLVGAASTATVQVSVNGLTSDGDIYYGDSGDNVISGTSARNFFRVEQGGDDTVNGLAGNDTFYFGKEFTAGDTVNGDLGNDAIILQGNYSAGITFGTGTTSNIDGVESISLAPGNFNDWGDTANQSYSYNLTTLDSNVDALGILKVNGFWLRAGENLTFNGSDETDGKFIILAGQGVDTLTGGDGNDIFAFGHDGRFGSGDVVTGGPGYDSVYLRGDYTIDFNAVGFAGSLVGIESVTLGGFAETAFTAGGDGEFDYSIVWNDSMLATGSTITFNGSGLSANESMTFDGSQETGGKFRLWGGAARDTLTGGNGDDLIYGGVGWDTLTGGGGSDTFRYHDVSESASTPNTFDSILAFTHLVDKIDLSVIDANANVAGDQAFSFIGSSAFSPGGASAGQLRAVLINAGTNTWQVEADVNGDGTPDMLIRVSVEAGQPLTAADFYF